MKWKISSKIEGHNKLLRPKLNFLWKHVHWKKVDTTVTCVVTWEYYFLKTKQCVFNEHLYVFRGKDFVVQFWGNNNSFGRKKKKLVQFAFIFHFVFQDRLTWWRMNKCNLYLPFWKYLTIHPSLEGWMCTIMYTIWEKFGTTYNIKSSNT